MREEKLKTLTTQHGASPHTFPLPWHLLYFSPWEDRHLRPYFLCNLMWGSCLAGPGKLYCSPLQCIRPKRVWTSVTSLVLVSLLQITFDVHCSSSLIQWLTPSPAFQTQACQQLPSFTFDDSWGKNTLLWSQIPRPAPTPRVSLPHTLFKSKACTNSSVGFKEPCC